MTTPDTTSRAGEDLSPAEELKAAMRGFVTDFKDFSNGVTAKLKKQEDRMNKLDRKTLMGARPVLSMAADQTAPHAKAFAAYFVQVMTMPCVVLISKARH